MHHGVSNTPLLYLGGVQCKFDSNALFICTTLCFLSALSLCNFSTDFSSMVRHLPLQPSSALLSQIACPLQCVQELIMKLSHCQIALHLLGVLYSHQFLEDWEGQQVQDHPWDEISHSKTSVTSAKAGAKHNTGQMMYFQVYVLWHFIHIQCNQWN